MQSATAPTLPSTKRQRRLFVLHHVPDGGWVVVAEGSVDRHLFANRTLALGYAGLWASANPPSQLVERRGDGTLGMLKEYD